MDSWDPFVALELDNTLGFVWLVNIAFISYNHFKTFEIEGGRYRGTDSHVCPPLPPYTHSTDSPQAIRAMVVYLLQSLNPY